MSKYIQNENIIANNLIGLIVHLFLVLQIFISGKKSYEESLQFFFTFLMKLEQKERNILIIFSNIEKFINENNLILSKSNNKLNFILENNNKKYSEISFADLINQQINNHKALSEFFHEHSSKIM